MKLPLVFIIHLKNAENSTVHANLDMFPGVKAWQTRLPQSKIDVYEEYFIKSFSCDSIWLVLLGLRDDKAKLYL